MQKDAKERKLPDLQIVEQARLEAEKSLQAVHEQLRSSGILEIAERAKVIAERNREIQNALKPTKFYYPNLHASDSLTPPRINEELIASRVAKKVTDHIDSFRTRKDEGTIYLVIKHGEIFRRSDDTLKYSLTPKRIKLLVALKDTFRPTRALVMESGLKSRESVQKTIADLRSALISKLKLETSPIDSDASHGYRLNDAYRIILAG